MLDFLQIILKTSSKSRQQIMPKFTIGSTKDLMIRGGDFYAVWDEENKEWSTDETDVIRIVDSELKSYYKANKESFGPCDILYMRDSDSGSIDRWHKYCQKQMRDSYHNLDETIIFSNTEVRKENYSSKHLPYPLLEGEYKAYDKLMSVLYEPEERRKLEWAIGSIVSGDSKNVQKFIVLYGEPGSGKSTFLNIVQELFDGYYTTFDAEALGNRNSNFALEPFKNNPLVAIQHDGDLSKIDTNIRLNSVASHEIMTVDAKFTKLYSQKFNAFLFMGTNKPVKITDAKSGILRRLIDVVPSGNRISKQLYSNLMNQIKFELGAIASHCLEVYKEDPGYYDDYVPIRMMGASNDFYNFVQDSWDILSNEKGVTLKSAWALYKKYCEDASVSYPYSMRVFREELKNYFKNFYERIDIDGVRIRSYYSDFITDKFESKKQAKTERARTLKFSETSSIFDEIAKDYPAQYANSNETPNYKWKNVKTSLKDLDTHNLHYVKLPENHIVIDFDIKDKDGNKSLEKNLKAASAWPDTYGELSKSGQGVHLHYIYDGDVGKLSRIYDDGIEVKVFTGDQSLRRKLTYCNNLEIAHINTGLPLKGEDGVIKDSTIKSERALRTLIKRNLNKEIHPGTKPSIDFIFKILEDSYNAGLKYDISDMRQAILTFAANSTHKPGYCLKMVNKMKFKSDEPNENLENNNNDILAFFDVEVYPNLFIVVWKPEGGNCVRMINPSPAEIENLLKLKLVGFNCRRYDNHILYARLMGYSNEELYRLSQRIIGGSSNAMFGEAYNLSYTDIYDFSSKKQSLKKFEIELDIHHQEMGIPWDKPVPENMWDKVAQYCENDVIATEAVFYARKADWIARQILADLAEGSVNDTTNQLTTKIIFGKEKHPKLVYTDLATGKMDEGWSSPYINSFPGYEFKQLEDNKYHNLYLGEDVGFGGYVYAEPGMYSNVALLDIVSMHPHSTLAMNCFGEYTKKFKELIDARIAIKHKDWNAVETMLDGKLKKYISSVENGEFSNKDLANALKIAINSVYGLTSASFDNPFRDPRNLNNIVALRGALFMVNLKHEVQKKGFTVAHIKTDSIKIPNATSELIEFVMDYGKKYGYFFEHEATYEKMCLVNDAVYIAKDSDGKWTATGTQFQIPYVFKTLFSKEPIEFKDLCETKSVTTSLYLDMNESLPQDEHDYVFVGKVGSFCPIVSGAGGGILLREKDGKYYAATGSKGYRWLEAEVVRNLNKESDIDRGYYNRLVDEAVKSISEYGDFEQFAE